MSHRPHTQHFSSASTSFEHKLAIIRRLKLLRQCLILIASITLVALIYLGQQAYQQSIDPSVVYGEWIELQAPPYNTERLTFNQHGVFRDHRRIATQFQFDGKQIRLETGAGVSVYQLAGTLHSPQLKRVQPSQPTQRFIKQGFEHTVTSEDGGPAQRRQALSEHFQP